MPTVPGYTFTRAVPVDKGWSGDRKFDVEIADGRRFLLRLSDNAQYARRQESFALMQQADALGTPMCRPVDFGTCADGEVYTLYEWIDGEDLEVALPLFSDVQQYALGLQAGEILRRLHTVPAPEGREDWAAFYTRRVEDKIRLYRDCGVRFEGDEAVIAYLEAHRHLAENRPQCLRHGDYHAGNMLLTPDGGLCVIDWEKAKYGDPWEAFTSIVWNAPYPHFVTGQLRGYFGGEPPAAFFERMLYYIAVNMLSYVWWSIPFGQADVDTAIRLNADIFRWFDGLRNPMPTWYLRDLHVQWIDGVPLRLKQPFDLDFIHRYGTVFKVFDGQDSGNLCFGTERDGQRYFVKFAGAPTVQYDGTAADAIARLKAAVPVYRTLTHPALIRLVGDADIGGGYAAVFEWADAVCMHRMYPRDHLAFGQLPTAVRLRVFADILDFHAHVAAKGYAAIDFYDGSIMWDAAGARAVLCDIDFYAPSPYINRMGRLWGSTRFMSPEEHELGGVIDEITNVYTMGATAFALFAGGDRAAEAWTLSPARYAVAMQAVSDDRSLRQPSIRAFISAWEASGGGGADGSSLVSSRL